ncbi:MAG: hypothetical protein KJZ74_02325 [Gemmatimonadales bacterium]|nr:hypothetical protein [Gemmatimonadales bacterium]
MTERLGELSQWMARVSAPGWRWYVKYIAANDTYAKPEVHQGGPYVGKELLRAAFPELTARAEKERNPDVRLPVTVASHNHVQEVRLVWYNSRRFKRQSNGRDEARLTQWGGMDHPLVAAEATGSLSVFAFNQLEPDSDSESCELWIAADAQEEDEILGVMGPVDPGRGRMHVPVASASEGAERARSPCSLREIDLLPEWRTELPSGEDLLEMALHRIVRVSDQDADERLLARRACEFELFLSIESHVVLPRVTKGFSSVEEFVSYANGVTNRRKARAGRSLELHARAIFHEERIAHSWAKATEDKRTPDFVFPSIQRYHDSAWPSSGLRMLAAKTTCKDRWRQILSEAARIPEKHLLTLQEGVSPAQFSEMKEEGVQLVVPRALHTKYPKDVQAQLLTLERFLGEVRDLA